MSEFITAAVGKNSTNNIADVRLVQELLNEHIAPKIGVTGVCEGIESDRTVVAIKKFQAGFMTIPDGIISPGGKTIKALKMKWTQLPQTFGFSSGYYQYGQSSDIGARQWGSEKTVETLVNVCKKFKAQQVGFISHSLTQTPHVVGIGDISFNGGGYMKPHGTHQTGINVDLRPCRKDAMWQQVTIGQTADYDAERTKILIELFLADPNVNKILFNDKQIYQHNSRVSYCVKHDNHFHITMKE